MSLYTGSRSLSACSTSERVPRRFPAPYQPALLHARRNTAQRYLVCQNATNIEKKQDVSVSSNDSAKFEAISAALEARLQRLHEEAPEDQQMIDMSQAALEWDEDELFTEGKALQREAMERSVSTEAQDEARPKVKRAVKPVPKEDPNEERKRRGNRLIVSEVPIDTLPKVAIVGRPNVGKSALFNRIVAKKAAIVYDTPGVTRDRLYMRTYWGGREFVLVDTGGLMSSAASLPAEVADAAMAEVSAADLPFAIERQAAAGISESDVVVMLCDGQTGPTVADEEVIGWLRRVHSDKRVLLAVNKCESATQGDVLASMFWGYGLEPLPISAISGTGTGELMERLVAALPPAERMEAEAREKPLAVAIVGRPNVGKSSLVNAVTGTARAIVSDLSGTTRDAVDTEVTLPDGTPLTLVDTAGIRRRAKVASSEDGAEPMSVVRAIRALRRTDVVAIMLDAAAGVTVQDYRIAELAAAEGRAVVIVVNKWDKANERGQEAMRTAEATIKEQLRPVSWAKCVFTCATQGKNVHKVLKACIDAGEQHMKRVTTGTLNLVVSETTAWKSPPSIRGTDKKPKIYYATQAAVRPPTFVFFCSDGRLIGDDYKRYLENSLRQSIDLDGTPIRLFFRGKSAPSDTSGARSK